MVPGETGILVPPGDPQSLGQAVISLLADPQLALQMGEQPANGLSWLLALVNKHKNILTCTKRSPVGKGEPEMDTSERGSKFVVLSSQRSGTTWLISLLNQLEARVPMENCF